MFDLRKLIRPHLLELKPYSSARDEYKGNEGIFLDANENAFGAVTGHSSFHRYPDPYQSLLKEKLAGLRQISIEQVFLGNGSDEVIDLLIRLVCEPGQDGIVILPPTYGMYEVSAAINKVSITAVPLDQNFQPDPARILAKINSSHKLLFVCSPNNPSGNLADKSLVIKLLENFKGLVVVDEAYIDFADDPGFLPELQRYPNLFVMQTFSKSWGLASLRLGAGFGHPMLISCLTRIKPPYNINGFTQETGLQALANLDEWQAKISQTLEQKNWLQNELRQTPGVEYVYPSKANFLLTRVDGPDELYRYLISKKIIVRNRSNVILCEGCLRITVGKPEENQKLIENMKLYYREKNPVEHQ
jgi:histidinol-phosphate aminotransferase